MADVNANINILINTQGATGALRTLQSQISNFNRSVAASNAGLASSQKALTSNLAAQIAATGAFSTSLQKVETNASRLQTAIDKNRLSLGEYFRYGIASSGAFGRVFQKEHNEIMDLAADRVKRLQTQYLALGRAQRGMTDTMAVRPLQLHNADAAIGVQRQQLFNKLLRDGATSMVNWGKNTQWAGRQLMVGFTVPLTIFGGYAASIFMDLDKQITQFKRVYGDAMTPTAEADAMVRQIQDLAEEYTKYGITVSDSIEMAAKAAATGLQGEDLLAATEEALRLATLGQMEYQQALDATISLQSAFGISSQELATEIDFLNAVENQTIVSLDDISQAIPRVAPVIKGLGGDVRDLAAMLAAMREGGVNAAEGANALKSGLASLINPSKQANEVLSDMGINLEEIVKTNEGDLMGTVMDFAEAIQDLSNLDRQKALATLFGKYQFARMGALFKNIIRDGSQAQRVMELAGMSVQELAALSEKDLSRLEESVSVKFLGAVERLKLALAPIGEEFLKVVTPIIEFVTQILERFNNLSPEVKKWGLILIAALGGVLPVLVMVAGLFGNFLGNMVKGAAILKGFFSRILHGGRSMGYMEGEMLDAVAASNSLEGASNGVTRALNVQRAAVIELARAYGNYLRGAAQAMTELGPGAVGGTSRKPPPLTGAAAPSPTPTGPVPIGGTGAAAWGKRQQVNVKGSYESAHISSMARDLTLQEVQQIINDPKTRTSIADKLRQVIQVGEDGREQLTKSVMGYTNEVVQIPKTVHGELTNKKETSLAKLRTSLVKNADFAHTQLAMTMRNLGASEDQITKAISYLTKNISSALDKIEQQSGKTAREIMISAEEFERIVGSSYSSLRNSGAQFRKDAIDELRKIQTVSLDRGSNRDAVSAASYKDRGNRGALYEAMRVRAQEIGAPIPFGKEGAIQLESRLEKLNISIKQAADLWNQLSRSAQRSLIAIGNDSALFTATFVDMVRQAGLVAGTELEAAFDSAFDGTRVGADQAAEVNAGMGAVGLVGPDGRPISSESERIRQSQEDDAQRRREVSQTDPSHGYYTDLQTGMVVAPDGRIVDDYEKELEDAAKKLQESEGNLEDADDKEGKVKKGLKSFGSALMKGSAKLQGGLFALDGLVFGLSMMDNQIGQFASQIMPAVFAFQGISMLLPALFTPVGAAIAGLAAAGAAALYFKMRIDDVAENAQTMANALVANTEIINGVGEFFGRTSMSESARDQRAVEISGTTSAEIQKAEEFLATGVGQQITAGLQQAFSNFSQGTAAEQFAGSLASMMLQGVINMKEAKAIATVLGQQLGNETFGIQVIGQLKELVGPNGQNIKDSPFKVALDIESQNRQLLANYMETQLPQAGTVLTNYMNKDFAQSFAGGFLGEKGMTFLVEKFGAQATTALMTGIMAVPGVGPLTLAAATGFDQLTKSLMNNADWSGELARSIQGWLNPSLDEAIETTTEFSSIAGNVMVQSYENLYSAQQRQLDMYKQLSEARKAEKEDSTKATRQAVLEAENNIRRSERQEKALIDSIQRTKAQAMEAFRETTDGQAQMIEGINESLASMYEGMGTAGGIQQGILDSLAPFFAAGGMESEYRIKLEILSGNLNASTVQALLSSLGGTREIANMLMALEFTLEGDTKAAGLFMESVAGAGFDEEFTKNLLIVAQATMTPEQLQSYTTLMQGIASVPDEDLKKNLAVDAIGAKPEEILMLNSYVNDFNALPDNMQKLATLAYEEYGVAGFGSAIDNAMKWMSIQNSSLSKEAKIELMMKDFDKSKKEIEKFFKANEEKKMKLLLEWSEPKGKQSRNPLKNVPSHLNIQTEITEDPDPPTKKEIMAGLPSHLDIPTEIKPEIPEPAELKQLMESMPPVELPVAPTGAEKTEFIVTMGGTAETELAGMVQEIETERNMSVGLTGNIKEDIPKIISEATTLRTMPVNLGGNAKSEMATLVAEATKTRYMTVKVTYVETNSPPGSSSASSPEGPFAGGLIGSKGRYPGNTRKFNSGGQAVPGDGGRDSVLALLAPGEFVMRKRAVDQYGESFFRALNMGAYFGGGKVLGGIKKFHKGGKNDKGDNDGKDKDKDYDEADTNRDGEVSDAERKEEDIKNALKDFKDSLDEIIQTYIGINASLKDFINGSLTVTEAVLKGGGLQQMLSKAGLNQAMIDEVLGMGIDAAKKWYKQYTDAAGKLTKEGLAQVKAMMAGFIIEQMSGFQTRFADAQAQRNSLNAAMAGGAGRSVALEISSNPESAQAYMMLIKEMETAKANLDKAMKSGKGVKQAQAEYEKSQKAVKKYESAVRAALDAEEKLADKIEEVQRVVDQMQQLSERRVDAQAQTRSVNYLRRQGASDEMVQEIGGDPESAKAYATLLEEQARAEKALAKAREKGQGIPNAKKRYKDAQEAVAAYERRVRAAQEAEEALAKALDPVAWGIDQLNKAREETLKKTNLQQAQFDQEFGKIDREYDPQIKAAEKRVKDLEKQQRKYQDEIDKLQEESDDYQHQVDLINREIELENRKIEAIERTNELDQRRIESIQRANELLNREIESIEKLNELDQKTIDGLQREDELRNRVSDAISHDLELMSQQEDKINKTYQERIDSLESVAKVNQNILDQQRNQLSLSQALSQGDIYAAAQAVQERRSMQAQYAADQTRASLEQGMQNAVAGLRTQGGLTREQAEAKINEIKEQSYQTSLKIRDVEDKIYARNVSIDAIKEKIRVNDLAIREIEDGIYSRNAEIEKIKDGILKKTMDAREIEDKIYEVSQKIYKIQEDNLEPLQNKIELENRSIENLEEERENKKSNVKIDGLTYEQLQNKVAAEEEAYNVAVAQIELGDKNIAQIENIVKKWEDVASAIAEANRVAKQQETTTRRISRQRLQAVVASKLPVREKQALIAAINEKLRKDLEKIEQDRIDAIEKARSRVPGYSENYRGGMINKYAGGSFVQGTGNRDSVAALLTPGEFVMRKAAVKKYGAAMLEKMNMGAFRMPSYYSPKKSFSIKASGDKASSPVYNSYEVNVSVAGTNASADEIANRAVMKIKQMNSNQIRGSRG